MTPVVLHLSSSVFFASLFFLRSIFCFLSLLFAPFLPPSPSLFPSLSFSLSLSLFSSVSLPTPLTMSLSPSVPLPPLSLPLLPSSPASHYFHSASVVNGNVVLESRVQLVPRKCWNYCAIIVVVCYNMHIIFTGCISISFSPNKLWSSKIIRKLDLQFWTKQLAGISMELYEAHSGITSGDENEVCLFISLLLRMLCFFSLWLFVKKCSISSNYNAPFSVYLLPYLDFAKF